MSVRTLFRGVLGVENTVVEDVTHEPSGTVVVAVRPTARQRDRCGRCHRRAPGYDTGDGRRRWRSLDLGVAMCFLEADAPRVRCPDHGVVVAHVPWAVHGAGHTHAFDRQVAWLAVRSSKSTIAELMRIAWRSVGAIVTRVYDQAVATELAAGRDGLEGLRRIGIDEISYRRGQLYLTVIVDHDTGFLVWAQPGRDKATLRRFFDDLGPERSSQLTHVSADQASWIKDVVTQRAPAAIQCADPFHIVQWANKALNTVRAQIWREVRAAGATRKNGTEQGRQRRDSTGDARALAHSKWALIKNPENLSPRQNARLDWIAATHPHLWEAYRLKEGLRLALRLNDHDGHLALDEWLHDATTSNVPAFAHLATRIKAVEPRIKATQTHHMTNARVESINTKIRLLTRIAYGFHGPEPLIALAMLSLGPHQPRLRHPRI